MALFPALVLSNCIAQQGKKRSSMYVPSRTPLFTLGSSACLIGKIWFKQEDSGWIGLADDQNAWLHHNNKTWSRDNLGPGPVPTVPPPPPSLLCYKARKGSGTPGAESPPGRFLCSRVRPLDVIHDPASLQQCPNHIFHTAAVMATSAILGVSREHPGPFWNRRALSRACSSSTAMYAWRQPKPSALQLFKLSVLSVMAEMCM